MTCSGWERAQGTRTAGICRPGEVVGRETEGKWCVFKRYMFSQQWK